MITRHTVSEKLLTYLNSEIILAELVDWAENSVGLSDFEPDEDIEMLMKIMMYLAGADTAYFPLTWDVLVEFLNQLGTPVRIVPV